MTRTEASGTAPITEEGSAIVRTCIRHNRPGPFQLQAAIQAAHCNADSFQATDWRQIVRIYDRLYHLMPTPVVALNRAIAIGATEGPGAALTGLDAIAADLDGCHLMHAARGTELRQLGQRRAVNATFQRAADFAPTEKDRRLAQQIEMPEQGDECSVARLVQRGAERKKVMAFQGVRR